MGFLMRTILIAALGVAVCATAARADYRYLAIRNAAQVTIMSKICARVHLDDLRFMAMLKAGDINIDRDRDDLSSEMAIQVTQWKGRDPNEVCEAALRFYGPNGALVPNLLSEN